MVADAIGAVKAWRLTARGQSRTICVGFQLRLGEMMAELFADTIGRIDFAAGVVRFELVSIEPTEGGQNHMEARQRVVMPLEGFLSALSTMGNLVNKLVEAGVVRANPPAAEPAPAATKGKAN